MASSPSDYSGRQTSSTGLVQRSNMHSNGDVERGPHSSDPINSGMEEMTEKHTGGHRRRAFVDRMRGRGRNVPTVSRSLMNIARSSVLNVLLVFFPVSWGLHFKFHTSEVPHIQLLIFSFSFLTIIPLEKMFDFIGEQAAFYLGKDLGDLVVITLNNVVEATLAVILLLKHEYPILQSTIVGVVLLHLLLVPGTAFLSGGARIWEQHLHPHTTQLNHSLLTLGVLTLLLPSAFFESTVNNGNVQDTTIEEFRPLFLSMSRGLAILLLLVYIGSRIFLHNPPGDNNAMKLAPNAPKELHEEEHKLEHEDPEVGPFVCLAVLAITIPIMAVTAEFLVEGIEFVRKANPREKDIKEEWFGLILLPLVSFAADGAVAAVFFIRKALFLAPEPPATIAKARAIDLSIQFTLFWMPFLVLLAWWTHRTFSLLFDLYQVAIVIGACFLVNYVTADAKTNWAEGMIMVTFYIMIALVTWFYPDNEASIIGRFLCANDICPKPEHGEAAGDAAATSGEFVVRAIANAVLRK